MVEKKAEEGRIFLRAEKPVSTRRIYIRNNVSICSEYILGKIYCSKFL